MVEDDQDLSDTLKDWLECMSHSVDTAFTGPEALERMRAGRYDVILMDWQLPDMLGVNVVKEYRSGGGADTVLMLTGQRDLNARKAGLEAGANDFLPKPFTLDQLLKRLQEMLAKQARG